MSQLSEEIASRSAGYLDDLKAFLSFPSISAEGRALEEASDFLMGKLRSLGFNVSKARVDGAPPLVIADLKGRSDYTLVFYNHYDVQPVDPISEWRTDPFSPTVSEGRLFARGVADDKGDLMARVHAVETLLARGEGPPISVKFVVEGEEEEGSPHLKDYVEKYGSLMKGDVCLWEGFETSTDGRPQVFLGCKGLLYVELKLSTASADLHSMYGPIAVNPAWRLVWLMAKMKDEREKVLIPGFYDDVVPPTEEELEMLARNSYDVDALRRSLGVRSFLRAGPDLELLKDLYFRPTCNIAGFSSGYSGPGSKTIVPREATVKIDFRLVPSQDPAKVLARLKEHMLSLGYGDVQVKVFGEEAPAKVSPEAPEVRRLVEAAKESYGSEVNIWPTIPATGPMAIFVNELGLPSLMPPSVPYPGSSYHAPNEHIMLSQYWKSVEFFSRAILKLAPP
jgi:acetylornithine deacetylase/succinyl-diaminopimelate desuccinylase-like protein